jgi:hypothetical protein
MGIARGVRPCQRLEEAGGLDQFAGHALFSAARWTGDNRLVNAPLFFASTYSYVRRVTELCRPYLEEKQLKNRSREFVHAFCDQKMTSI